jgi:peptide/nickel transport system permease protein
MISSSTLVPRGIAAAKAGDRDTARDLFAQAIRANQDLEAAYLWLSATLATPQGKAFCLRQVLALNPANGIARRGLAALEKAEPARVLIARPPSTPRVAGPDQMSARHRQTATIAGAAERRRPSTLARIGKYAIVRALAIAASVVVAVYLTIFIANMGGYVDKVVKAEIDLAVGMMSQNGPLRFKPIEERNQILAQTREAMYEAAGVNQPFLLRTVRWLKQGLTLDWGDSRVTNIIWHGRSTGEISKVILDALPRTLLLFGGANVLLFFTSLSLALVLTRRYGGLLDRIVVFLSPLSAAPAWAYGVILSVTLLPAIGILSTGGTFDAWPTEFRLAYLPHILKYMLLPFLAIFLSGLFQSVYAWRTFFLAYSSEDHVEMATAMGLPRRRIERRHILRLGLPAVITSFALLMVGLWQQVIALEMFFNVAGIGQLLMLALRRYDIGTTLGVVVTFAYLLAITVFLLDFAYALVDPRVRIGTEGRTLEPVSRKKRRGFRQRFLRRPGSAHRPASRPRSALPAPVSAQTGRSLSKAIQGLGDRLRSLRPMLAELVHYPSAMAGLAIILVLVGVSIYAVTAIPYNKAVALWRGDDNVWYRNPQKALPEWVNLFRKDDLPRTIVLDSQAASAASGGTVHKSRKLVSEGMEQITISYVFDYPYSGFPQDLTTRVQARYDTKKPLITLTWVTPDGREIELTSATIVSSWAYHLSQDNNLERKLGGQPAEQALFADPAQEAPVALQGRYELRLDGFVFEPDADLDAEMVLYGQVYGLAGTDYNRRDMMIALLWGTPVALAFGLLAAVGTSVSTMVIAGIGVWFGGWVDALIQRITEVNMILPFLPVSIMVYTLYSKSFWVILGVTVLLSVFGTAIKNYRAMFLQMKEAPYIEAAQAYGAGNWRIIFRYLVPRIGVVLVPQFVILVPSYVFLEATLAFLQVSDPVLPTWGKLVVEALAHSVHSGDYHLILEPVGLLLLTGFGFALLGFSLERIFEPRLRDI